MEGIMNEKFELERLKDEKLEKKINEMEKIDIKFN